MISFSTFPEYQAACPNFHCEQEILSKTDIQQELQAAAIGCGHILEPEHSDLLA